MKKFFFLALSGLFILNTAFCSTVDTTTAKAVATQFFLSRASQSSQPSARSIASEGVELILAHQEYDDSVSPANTQPCYYIYNVKGDKGFVIVSADDAVVPVLGYSFKGKYDPANEAPAFTEWMKQYMQQITHIKANPSEAAGNISEQWREGRTTARSIQAETPIVEVAPLVTAQWNQGCYYNQYCPQDVNSKYCGRTLVGCVAVAMGQIINYHKYPDVCTEIPGYTYENKGKTSYGWIDNIPASTYNWSDMANKLDETSSEQQIDAVAKLLYHCGVAVKMNYGSSVSGSDLEDVPAALFNYFNYSASSQYIEKVNYSALDWKKMMKNELDNNRPILYGASYHAFVCDGYQDNDYFHFNWGWGGQDNNYFYINNLTVGNYSYNSFPSAIIGISKVSVPFLRIAGNELQDGSFEGSIGNSNNLPEPGETIRIPVTMTNDGSLDAENVTAVLSCSDPNITILNGTQNWLNIQPDSMITTDFRFSISSASVSTIDTVTLTVTSGTETWVKDYPLNIFKNVAVEVPAAGMLHTLFSPAERSNQLYLSISGTIDARDFVTLRDSFPVLQILDLTNATIEAYEGDYGPTIWESNYPANTIPFCAFFDFETYKAKVSLTSVTLPSSLKTVGLYAFNSCKGLTSIHFPQTLHSIEMNAFNYTNLTSIILPDSVSFIGSGAFSSCTQLTSVVLGAGLDSIGSGVFDNCDALTDITISQQNEKYTLADGILFSNDATILYQCFTSNKGEYAVPEGVTSIAENAFNTNEKLTSVTLPSTLLTIGKSAFYYCWDLADIHCKSVIPPLVGESAFEGLPDSTTLYVPSGSYTAYATAAEWSNFTLIIEEEVTSVPQTADVEDDLTLYSVGDAIVLKGVLPGTVIAVYSETGALVQTVVAMTNPVHINLPAGHTYLISVAGKTVKIAL